MGNTAESAGVNQTTGQTPGLESAYSDEDVGVPVVLADIDNYTIIWTYDAGGNRVSQVIAKENTTEADEGENIRTP